MSLPCQVVPHKWYIGIAQEWDQDPNRDQMWSTMPWKYVHTGLRQDSDHNPLSPIVLFPFHVLVPAPFPCIVNKPKVCISFTEIGAQRNSVDSISCV